jgi:hypothetical protein
VANRMESECFTVEYNCLFQILHLAQVVIAYKNRNCEVGEGNGTIRVTKRMESECFAVGCDPSSRSSILSDCR